MNNLINTILVTYIFDAPLLMTVIENSPTELTIPLTRTSHIFIVFD